MKWDREALARAVCFVGAADDDCGCKSPTECHNWNFPRDLEQVDAMVREVERQIEEFDVVFYDDAED